MESNIAISKRFDKVRQNCESLKIAAPFFNTDFPCRSTDRPSLLSNGAPCSDHKNVGCHILSPPRRKNLVPEIHILRSLVEVTISNVTVLPFGCIQNHPNLGRSLFFFESFGKKKKRPVNKPQRPQPLGIGCGICGIGGIGGICGSWLNCFGLGFRWRAPWGPQQFLRDEKNSPTKNTTVEPADLLQGSFLYFL